MATNPQDRAGRDEAGKEDPGKRPPAGAGDKRGHEERLPGETAGGQPTPPEERRRGG